MTVAEYGQKMKKLADSLNNVDAPVQERNLVMYVLNGLYARFDNIINVIKHRLPFPRSDSQQFPVIGRGRGNRFRSRGRSGFHSQRSQYQFAPFNPWNGSYYPTPFQLQQWGYTPQNTATMMNTRGGLGAQTVV